MVLAIYTALAALLWPLRSGDHRSGDTYYSGVVSTGERNWPDTTSIQGSEYVWHFHSLWS